MSGLAIVCLVLGVVVIFPLGFGLAVIPRSIAAATGVGYGIVALIQTRKSKGAGGLLASFGLVLNCMYLAIAILFSAMMQIKENSPRADCASNMKRIALAIDMYAAAHDGMIPRSFEDLRSYTPNLDKLLICPSAKDTRHPSYQVILGGAKWNSPETTGAVVVTENPSNHGGSGHNVLYGDGHVQWELLPQSP
jgi:prepilin-type processing-associated H-X9-DG protein